MASIRGKMRERGVGSMLRVEDLLTQFPECKGFTVVVITAKESPKGANNCAFVLVVDETPISETEIGVNVSNANKISRFLNENYGSDDWDLLKDHVIEFSIKEHKGYVDGDPNAITRGLDISRIEPADLEAGYKTMTFTAEAPVKSAAASGDEPSWKKRRALLNAQRAKLGNAQDSANKKGSGGPDPDVKKGKK